MSTKNQINFFLKLLFIFVAFIFSIKQECETNRVDFSDCSNDTYTEFVVKSDNNLLPSLISFFSLTSQDTSFQHGIFYFQLLPISLKSSIKYLTNNNYYIPDSIIQVNNILKIIQTKNICHKSSDDIPAPDFFADPGEFITT